MILNSTTTRKLPRHVPKTWHTNLDTLVYCLPDYADAIHTALREPGSSIVCGDIRHSRTDGPEMPDSTAALKWIAAHTTVIF